MKIISQKLFVASFFIFLFISGCVNREEHYGRTVAPTLLPFTQKEMNSPSFWIKLHPSVDKIILTPIQITSLNKKTEDQLKLSKDITKIGLTYSARELVSRLQEDIKELRENTLFDGAGHKIREGFYRKMKKYMRLKQLSGNIKVSYGFVTRRTDQRSLPTSWMLTQEPGDLAFDELQNNSLDIAIPLAILNQTEDGKWFYVDAPTCHGWVDRKDVVFCTRDELKDFMNKKPFIVVTAAKGDIFLDPDLSEFYSRLRMGVTLPLVADGSKVVKALIPTVDSRGKFSQRAVYLKKDEVHIGFLPFTSRTMIEQAFRVFPMPYGWGCSPDEQDCSGFIQEIFASVGIVLPRNAYEQRLVGRLIGGYDKEGDSQLRLKVFQTEAIGGITTVWLKGHIMLFLGMYKERPYVIHATYGYKEKTSAGIIERIVNRVVVSDLSLGKGTPKGSLLERTLSIRVID
ncbi:MAG: SH3 domain-containing protein [Candidatus Omnitrophica bacterium]|nr:SH3 domain-containing protein [Candidatus Omnitrophota bacterium]